MYEFKKPLVAIPSHDEGLPQHGAVSDRDTRLSALDDNQLDTWNERVAICVVDGGLTQEEAEAIAWREVEGRPMQPVDAHVGLRAASVAKGVGGANG